VGCADNALSACFYFYRKGDGVIMQQERWEWLGAVLAILAIAMLTGVAPPQMPASSLPQGAGVVYFVQMNDTLWSLAEKYLEDGRRYPEIVEATRIRRVQDPSFALIKNPSLLQPGWKLWVPLSGTTEETPTAVPSPTNEVRPTPERPPDEPTGHIAFSFYNPADYRKVYEINIIRVECASPPEAQAEQCGTGHEIFPIPNASEPALSPDGTLIAFRSWGTYENLRSLAVSRLDGSDLHSIGGFWEDALPAWRPDGQRLVFASQREGDRRWRMYTISPDGSNEYTLRRADRANLFGEDPAWGPDNHSIVYRGCDPTGNRCGLWIMTEDGKEFTSLIEDPQAASPAWSPVDDRIAFMSARSGNWDLYIIHADGKGLAQISKEPSVEGLPAWSPDGKWLALLSDRGGEWSIYIMHPDGSDVRQVFAFDGGNFSPPATEVFAVRSWASEQISWSK
jgi:hypothetical protein